MSTLSPASAPGVTISDNPLLTEAGVVPDTQAQQMRANPAKHFKHNATAYLMIAPMVVGLGIFVFWPLLYSFYMSLYEINFHLGNTFVGLRFYRLVLTDRRFWNSILIGLQYAAMVVPTGMVVALLLASFIKTLSRKLASFMKVAVLVPAVISSVVVSLLFLFMYQEAGVANATLALLNIGPIAWLNNPSIALSSLAVPGVWMGLGLTTLIMLAGLLDIPESYYEAAKLEGAGFLKRTWYITIPLLKNVLLYLLVTGMVGALQMLDLPLIMTGGGPVGATTTPNLFMFNSFRDGTAFSRSFSLTSALLLFIVLGTISAAVFRLIKSEKSIDS